MTCENEAYVVVGAGGHALTVVATLQDLGHAIVGVYDDNAETWGSDVLGVPVRGGVDRCAGQAGRRGIIAIGDNVVRQRLAERLSHIRWEPAIHPSAHVHPTVTVGAGTIVCAGAVVQPMARLGRHVIVNTSASVDHGCVVGDFAHIAPGVHLAGDVKVGQGAMLGIGSIAMPAVKIGDWAQVGAAAAVIRDISHGCTSVGVPARIIKQPASRGAA